MAAKSMNNSMFTGNLSGDQSVSDWPHYQPVCAYQHAEAQSGKEPANCGLFWYVARVTTFTSGC
jgi:hypothetical protein